MTEQNRARTTLFQLLMQVTHKNYGPMVGAMDNALNEDPFFISKACVHMAQGGTKIRDQQDVAIISLLRFHASYPSYREAGRCLLLGRDVYDIEPDGVGGLEPFRIFRIEYFIRNSDRKVPRLMKGIASDYARMLEANPFRFDGVAIRNRKALRSLYRHYHIKPAPRAQAILFDNDPPEDSKLGVLKQIAASKSIREQVQLVVENRIPYRVAQSVLPKISPAVGVALIEVMSPTEALNSRHWVENSGLLQIPEVREAFQSKVSQATKSVASADFRASAQGQDAGVQAAVDQAKEKAVAQSDRITGQTDVYLDVSYSMMNVIEEAPRFAERIIPLCDDAAFYCHNDRAWPVRIKDTGNPYQDVRTALRGVRAGGGTFHHAAFEKSLQAGRTPTRIILLTDGGENMSGRFARVLQAYEEQTHIIPQIVMIHFQGGDRDVLTPSLKGAGYTVERFPFTGDYYLFDQVGALLGGPAAKSLVQRVLDTELPYRVLK